MKVAIQQPFLSVTFLSNLSKVTLTNGMSHEVHLSFKKVLWMLLFWCYSVVVVGLFLSDVITFDATSMALYPEKCASKKVCNILIFSPFFNSFLLFIKHSLLLFCVVLKHVSAIKLSALY